MSERLRGIRGRCAAGMVAASVGLVTLALPVGTATAEAPPSDTVWGWGRNLHGQLGDGSAGLRVLPERVLTGMAVIGAGDQHSLAVGTDGRAWSWGSNGDGQLGDGTSDRRGVPELMSGLAGTGAIADVDGGTDHSILLTEDGRVLGVGRNNRGQLGSGTTTDSYLPVETTGLPTPVRAISAGGDHNLALDAAGHVWAWGANGVGQLGVDGVSQRAEAALVPGLPQIVEIAAGVDDSFNAVLDVDGRVWTWGSNFSGELGDGTLTQRSTPAPVTLPEPVTDVSAGGGFAVALGTSGRIFAWGNNSSGQLGDGTTLQRKIPVPVDMPAEAPPLESLSAGGGMTYGRDSSGGVWAWGLNNLGYLGDGTTTSRSTPGPVQGLPAIAALDAGHGHALALDTEGAVWAWGRNNQGQLGDRSVRQRRAATRTRTMPPAAALSAGGEHVLALTGDGQVWAWGWNGVGQLGDGTLVSRGVPQPVPGLTGASTVAAGSAHSLAVTGGQALAWGDNLEGQLGDGTTTSRQSPTPVLGLPAGNPVRDVSAGYRYSTALLDDGSVWAWGANAVGQLGSGDTVARAVPGQVPGLGAVVALSSGYDHTLALKADGTVWAWGHGVGRSPQQVAGLPAMRSVSAGMRFSLAVALDGTVWAWGDNNDGQLGRDPALGGQEPARVPGLTGVTEVAAGGGHSLALLESGTVRSWGLNSQGELGDGSTTGSFVPRQVQAVTGAVAIEAGEAFSLAIAGPERATVATADPGATVTTDPDGYGATRSDPLQTSVMTPTGGSVVIAEQDSPASPSGFALLGKQVDITAPPGTVDQPLVVAFDIDASIVPAGESAESLQVLRNSVAAADCTDATRAVPDPCVSERTTLATGNVRLVVRTSHASLWNVAVRTAPANLAPTLDSAGVGATLVPVRSPVTASATFLDGDPGDSHRATWSWGDGSTCVTGQDTGCALSPAPGGGSTSATHAFTVAGTYTVSVTVRDAAGAEVTTVAGVVEVHAMPTDAAQCKSGGWQGFHFRNQGQCVSWVTSNRTR